MTTAVLVFFLVGLLIISAEHRLGISKSATALVFASVTWVAVALSGGAEVTEHLSIAGAEIIEILLFLLSAMALVEILAHYRFFDLVRTRIAARGIDHKRQLWILSGLAFMLSAIIDNLTTTIIFAQLARLFFKGKSLVIAAALIVISANAGGAFSPLGDVTTTMLWLQEKFTSAQIILYGFIPSFTMYLVAALLMVRQITDKDSLTPKTETVTLMKSEKMVITLAFGSFTLPFIFNLFGLKPYLGLLAGLGFTWMVIDIMKRKLPNHRSHFTAMIENLLQKTDLSSLMFFAGILLSVAALDYLKILEGISHALFGANPEFLHLVAGSAVMGVASAIVDNVPLTAAVTKIISTSNPQIWVLIALAVGTGGSLLAIGSAAGIVAMGIVKDLTFTNYLKVATTPAALAYVCAIAVWYLEHLLIN